MNFETSVDFIYQRIELIDPITYGKSRNFIDGAVTYLSPYISRGVISPKNVLDAVLDKGYAPKQIEKFIQELAWRDYWQQIWKNKLSAIDADLKRPQPESRFEGVPKAIIQANTGIEAIDASINEFYQSGYLHNHVRMYVASLCTNVAKCHWSQPARWMYYHLLDGDWASNALSWQWVSGANSNKKYFANQDNINKFCYSGQKDTFLDVSYEELPQMEIPARLQQIESFELKTKLPKTTKIHIDATLPTCLYNYYNLDPHWRTDEKANRILLLEPSYFENYPISEKSVQFALDLAKNIEGIQIFVGEFEALCKDYPIEKIYFKEHPTNNHYKGVEDPRDWMFKVEGYYPSFFAFWKRCKKEMKW